MRLALLPPVLLAVALAACGGADPSQHPTSSSPSRPLPVSHPTGKDQIVLRVTSAGGFLAPEATLRQLPQFALYGDGTLLVPGPVVAIYPGPALPPLLVTHLDEARVQALLVPARRAGLLVPGVIDYGDMGAVGIADAPTTTLELHADGRVVRRSAYALGIDTAGGGARLTATQRQARRALAEYLATLPKSLNGAAYTPTALVVYAGSFRGAPQPGAAPMVWPLASDLATIGRPVATGLDLRCVEVSGGDARTLAAALARANELTQWTARATTNATFRLIARPREPGEAGCAAR